MKNSYIIIGNLLLMFFTLYSCISNDNCEELKQSVSISLDSLENFEPINWKLAYNNSNNLIACDSSNSQAWELLFYSIESLSLRKEMDEYLQAAPKYASNMSSDQKIALYKFNKESNPSYAKAIRSELIASAVSKLHEIGDELALTRAATICFVLDSSKLALELLHANSHLVEDTANYQQMINFYRKSFDLEEKY